MSEVDLPVRRKPAAWRRRSLLTSLSRWMTSKRRARPEIPYALSEGETETVVYTGYDASAEALLAPVSVETGLSDGLRTEILSGLSEGDAIWYSYYDTLADRGLSTAPGTSY